MKSWIVGLSALTILNSIYIVNFDMGRGEQFDRLKQECREDDYTTQRHFDVNDQDLINLRRDIEGMRTNFDDYRFQAKNKEER